MPKTKALQLDVADGNQSNDFITSNQIILIECAYFFFFLNCHNFFFKEKFRFNFMVSIGSKKNYGCQKTLHRCMLTLTSQHILSVHIPIDASSIISNLNIITLVSRENKLIISSLIKFMADY